MAAETSNSPVIRAADDVIASRDAVITVGDGGRVISGDNSRLVGGDDCVLIAGMDSMFTAGKGSLLIGTWYDEKRKEMRVSQARVGELGLEPNTPYRIVAGTWVKMVATVHICE